MKKIISFFAIALILTVISLPPSAALSKEVQKDETIYASLGSDGSVEQLYVVNRLDTPQAGNYTDYGKYQSILNLSSSEEPNVSGEKILWNLPARSQGFYYQGQLAQGELPFTIKLDYSLNGVPVVPETALGKAGKIALSFSVQPNPLAEPYFRENYLTQIQIPLNLDYVTAFSAPGASLVIVGKNATIAYTVLPDSSCRHTLEFDTDKFQLDSISITSSPFDAASLIEFDSEEVQQGITALEGGMDKLIAGSKDLKRGLTDLDKGMGETAAGVGQLAAGASELAQGLSEYSQGATQLYSNADLLSGGVASLGSQGSSLTAGYTALSAGICQSLTQLSTELAPLLAMLPPDQQLAFSAMLEGMNSQVETQMAEFGTGLHDYTGGVSQAAHGISGLSQGLGIFAGQGQNLTAGADELAAGAFKAAKGLEELKAGTSGLPREIQKLVNGQTEVKNAMQQSVQVIANLLPEGKDLPPKSFVSDKNTPRSVQFVARTEALKLPEEAQDKPVEPQEQKGFWPRFLRLFKRK